MRKADSPLASPTSLGLLADDLDRVVKEIDLATWHLLCETGHELVSGLVSQEEAVEAACRLMDDGYEIIGVGTGPGEDAVDKAQLAAIYATWVKARY